ncbi:hypothetical protein ABH930_004556 [Kitasatospora sp. GAS204A]|uniref:hypothetical protein n=1 Tax=unclassified Kitasatospora TaxID=2633591 RepID=UPI002475501B|nr:hypothetical protein [Kitasatospora sp. GAS204B]MDH6119795.1 hypothetical protein [Kitasatospora sp. GAS204B]
MATEAHPDAYPTPQSPEDGPPEVHAEAPPLQESGEEADLHDTVPQSDLPADQERIDFLMELASDDDAQESDDEDDATDLEDISPGEDEDDEDEDDEDEDDEDDASTAFLVGKVVSLESVIDQQAEELEAVTSALNTVIGHIETLYQGQQQGQPAQDDDKAQPCRWSWRYASEENATDLWRELRDFVDWLNSRYSLDSERQIPPCWYRHSIAVEELTALMVSWTNAYFGPDTPRDDLLAWHSYWLWPCLDRLPERAGWQRCKSSGHVARSAVINPTDSGFEDFTGQAEASDEIAEPAQEAL